MSDELCEYNLLRDVEVEWPELPEGYLTRTWKGRRHKDPRHTPLEQLPQSDLVALTQLPQQDAPAFWKNWAIKRMGERKYARIVAVSKELKVRKKEEEERELRREEQQAAAEARRARMLDYFKPESPLEGALKRLREYTREQVMRAVAGPPPSKRLRPGVV